jgi:hypothetical protein
MTNSRSSHCPLIALLAPFAVIPACAPGDEAFGEDTVIRLAAVAELEVDTGDVGGLAPGTGTGVRFDPGAPLRPIDLPKAYETPGRWIVAMSEATAACKPVRDDVAAWKIPRRLFEQSGYRPALALAPFCLYERHVPGDAGKDDPPPNIDMTGVKARARDRWVLAPMAASLPPMLGESLRRAFLARAGFDFTGANPFVLPGPAVRVALIDSALNDGTDRSGPTVESHGHAVGRIIRQLSCPGNVNFRPGCFSSIREELALAYGADGRRNEMTSGQFGTLGDLASAVDAAVHHWWHETPTVPLIVNLSVGWEGEYGKDPEAPADAAVVPVYLALRRATCAGALVVAAAGNRTVRGSGPLYPGGWESREAPRGSGCNDYLLPDERAGIAVDPNPRSLVVAVGALDDHDRPVYNTPDGGRPALAAYGFAVSVGQAGNFTDAMTGTSAAAAVVSGIAAVVWSLDRARIGGPRRWPSEIARLIYDSGTPLHAMADFCPGRSAGPCSTTINRASLCSAVARVCATEGGQACQGMTLRCQHGTMPNGPFLDVSTAAWAQARSVLDPEMVEYDDGPRLPRLHPAVQVPPTFTRARDDVGFRQVPRRPECTEEPWLCPQPEPVGCSPCLLWGGQLLATITSDQTLTGAKLEVAASNGSTSTYDIDLTTAATIALTNPAPTEQPGEGRAYLVHSIPVPAGAVSATLTLTKANRIDVPQAVVVVPTP